MKIFYKFFVAIACLVTMEVDAQVARFSYTNASDFTVAGKIFPEIKGWRRADTSKYKGLPQVVKKLLMHGTGLAVYFTTNSNVIAAKWCVTDQKPYPNLTAIANKGLDLYIKKNDTWQFAGVGKPDGRCNEGALASNLWAGEKECLLYLPLYDEVSNVQIGVSQGASIKPSALAPKKRILVYGSSITQGASVSRPGMAYPARLSRKTGFEFLNLGLSGSAKMEPAVIDMINDVQADAYILDCIPNSSAQLIEERALNMIRSIRQAHPGKPVILLNTISREQGFIDQKVGEMVAAQNRAIAAIASDLIKQRTPDFYFIDTGGFLGSDHEGTVDGVHPNDLGSSRFLEKLEPQLTAILKKYFK